MTKEWSELSLYEKIRCLPDRHHFPVKCVLYLMFNVTTDVPWKAIYAMLERMGYVAVTLEDDLGGGMVRVTKGWVCPDGDVKGVEP